MDGPGAIALAPDFDGVITSVIGRFGPDAALYVIDHEFSCLVPLSHDGDAIDLDGEMRRAFLRARSFEEAGRYWTPLPERRSVVFVVAHDEAAPDDGVDVATVGALLGGHLDRFEDPERRRRRKNMQIAAEMQWDTLPLQADSLLGFDVAGVLEPAYEVAGDVFDYAAVDDHLWIYSFDGMGHGLDATISGLLALAAVRNGRRDGRSLHEQMRSANSVIFEQYGGDRFVTGAGCRIDPDGTVTVVNAGHEPIRSVVDGRVERLDLLVDLPLGVEPDSDYREQHPVTLRAGDGLVVLSDGLAGQSKEGESYGSDRLDESLTSRWSDTPLETGHDIVDGVLEFLDGAELDDDITVLVVRRHDDQGARS